MALEEQHAVGYDEAIAIAREIGECLGGRQMRALEVLARYASQGRKPSVLRMKAVRDVGFGAVHHFVTARHGLEAAQSQLHGTISACAPKTGTTRNGG